MEKSEWQSVGSVAQRVVARLSARVTPAALVVALLVGFAAGLALSGVGALCLAAGSVCLRAAVSLAL